MCTSTTAAAAAVVGVSPPKVPSKDHNVDKGKRNRRFVVGTFCSSLALFLAAGAYELTIRPIALPRIVAGLEQLLASIEPFGLASGTEACRRDQTKAAQFFFSTVIGSSKMCAAAKAADRAPLLGLVSELGLLVPLLLSVLITQWWKKTFVGKNGNMDSKDSTRSKEGVKVGSLLFVIAWFLWIVSAAALVTGILLGPSIVGVISVAALLAFFAQSVAGVGCLLLAASNEDDEIRREVQSIGESLATTVQASKWAHLDSKKGTDDHDVDSRTDQPATNIGPTAPHSNDEPALSPSRRSMAIQWLMKGKNREFILFFFMKLMLLQSPYAIQIGLHFLRTCVNCVGFHVEESSDDELGLVVPKELTGAVTFLCTLLVPLFTHSVGGILFHGSSWRFHHPFDGGSNHVTAQATGWSLIGVAGLLHLAFLIIGSGHSHVYLLHSGSMVSTVAEGLLLYSLIDFLPTDTDETEKAALLRPMPRIKLKWLALSYIQDFALTNFHWFTPLWLMATIMGFDMTHPFQATSVAAIIANAVFVAFVCALPTLLIPYTPRRKHWRWNPFGIINDASINFFFHREGLFADSELRCEENFDVYTREGAMFAMTPHGTLPTSVIAVWHQFEELFSDCCVFFGSQVSIVPNYKFLLGMRGGYLPIEKKRLVKVMESRQNVALVPGGVSEMLSCIPHGRSINVSIKHKGFVRLAMQQGYDLVPTFFFHANDQYNNPGRLFQLWTYKMTGVPVGIPLYMNQWLLPFSNRTPVKVALGKRIAVEQNPSPTAEEVDNVHRLFYEEVCRVWEKYKQEFGYGDRELAYVQ